METENNLTVLAKPAALAELRVSEKDRANYMLAFERVRRASAELRMAKAEADAVNAAFEKVTAHVKATYGLEDGDSWDDEGRVVKKS